MVDIKYLKDKISAFFNTENTSKVPTHTIRIAQLSPKIENDLINVNITESSTVCVVTNLAKDSGIYFKNLDVDINNYANLFDKIFDDSDVEDCQIKATERGHPDFKCKKDKEEFYIELKRNGDGLRSDQIGWIGDNLDKTMFCIFIYEYKK